MAKSTITNTCVQIKTTHRSHNMKSISSYIHLYNIRQDTKKLLQDSKSKQQVLYTKHNKNIKTVKELLVELDD